MKDATEGDYDLTLTLKEMTTFEQLEQVYSFDLRIVDMQDTTEPIKPQMYINSITDEGRVEVFFNQPLIVTNLTMGRNLNSIVNETALNLVIIPNEEDTDMSRKAFNWTATSFTADKMVLQIDFENPVYISSSGRDILEIQILNKQLFKSN